jgi:polyketide cyclase/dehydrase/lipid transport protein
MVWAALHEPTSLPALFPELSLGPAGPSWPAGGADRSGEAHLGLLRVPVRVESLEARPNTTFRIAVVSEGFWVDWSWRLEPIAGGTRVVHAGVFASPDRLAGLLARLGRSSFETFAETHLRALKALAEALASADPAA